MCKNSSCCSKKCIPLPGRRGPRGFPGLPGRTILNINNTVFVDQQYGNNITGERENESMPFATIQAALTVAVPGDTIYVQPGTYGGAALNINIPLNFYFTTGSVFTSTFNLNNGVDFRIDGYGVFRPENVLIHVFNASQISVKGNSVELSSPSSEIMVVDTSTSAYVEFTSIIAPVTPLPMFRITDIEYLSIVFDRMETTSSQIIFINNNAVTLGQIYINGTSIEINGQTDLINIRAALGIDTFFDVDTVEQTAVSNVPLFTIAQDVGVLDIKSSYMNLTSGVLNATSSGLDEPAFPAIVFVSINELFVNQSLGGTIPAYFVDSGILVVGQSTAMIVNTASTSLSNAIDIRTTSGSSFVSFDICNVKCSGYTNFINAVGVDDDVTAIFNGEFDNLNITDSSAFNSFSSIIHIFGETMIVFNNGKPIMTADTGSIHIDCDIIMVGVNVAVTTSMVFDNVDIHLTSQQFSIDASGNVAPPLYNPLISTSADTDSHIYLDIDTFSVNTTNITNSGVTIIRTLCSGFVHVKELNTNSPNGDSTFVSAPLPGGNLSIKTDIANLGRTKYLATRSGSSLSVGNISADMGIVNSSGIAYDFVNVYMDVNASSDVHLYFKEINNTGVTTVVPPLLSGWISVVSGSVYIHGEKLVSNLAGAPPPPPNIPLNPIPVIASYPNPGFTNGVNLYIDIDLFICDNVSSAIDNQNIGDMFIHIKKMDISRRSDRGIISINQTNSQIKIDTVLSGFDSALIYEFILFEGVIRGDINIGVSEDVITKFAVIRGTTATTFHADRLVSGNSAVPLIEVNTSDSPNVTVGGTYMKADISPILSIIGPVGGSIVRMSPTIAVMTAPNPFATSPNPINLIVNSVLSNTDVGAGITPIGFYTPNIAGVQ